MTNNLQKQPGNISSNNSFEGPRDNVCKGVKAFFKDFQKSLQITQRYLKVIENPFASRILEAIDLKNLIVQGFKTPSIFYLIHLIEVLIA